MAPHDLNVAPTARKRPPTLAELVDRLIIVQVKANFLAEGRGCYLEECWPIEHNIEIISTEMHARDG